MSNPPEPIKILVVDDTEANRYTLARHLRRAGYEITEAGTGQDALKLVAEKPDLVILDVKLPDINGFEISRMIRSNPATRRIPVLQVSATFTMSGDRVKGLDAGADAYLTGPVQPEELLANVRMLLRLKAAQDAVEKSNERLRSILETILDVYFAVDFEFRILELNPAAEALFDRRAADLLGKKLFEFLPGTPATGAFLQFQKAAENRQPIHFETESTLKAGYWWEAHLYPREDRIDVYLRDITERKVYERRLFESATQLRRNVVDLETAQSELAAARDKLSAQNEQLEIKVRERTAKLQETIDDLETFSYSITHDMRAPLRAMQGFARLLLEDHAANLDPEGLDFLKRIANSANRLDLLIRDVLSYSNVVRSPVKLVAVDADKLVRDILLEYPGMQPPAAQVSIQGHLPSVLANEAFLTQCFSNLLGNAVKFVPPNTTAIVEIAAESSNGQVRIRFTDNGIGIPVEHQRRLFTLFHRGQNSYPGTGVGLAVVRKAIERMGGQVGLQSSPGQGSTFWLELAPAPK